ncbi:MAG: DEAD/DEAH box helicase family protein [Lutibacter sp.]
MQTLEQKITAAITMGFIPIEVNTHISNNLNSKFKIRPYQLEAFARLNYYISKYPNKIKPIQLLFHMATGSGKTLVMAGAILDLYDRGYRNFIFFVNSSNIIDKTRDNFLNSLSSKYLFNDTISIADKKVEIKEVDNFEAANQEDINIVFTTIQGLHSKLNTPKENSITYEDFEDKKIVLLSDEAHHINAETKKGAKTKDEVESILSWEGTVNKIFNSNPENYLLEFTATADISNDEINKKYHDKLLFDYPLKQFRKDKYSKEVQVLQAELEPFERALQATILSQYRRKIFEKNQIHIKPVILFKSKTIKDSQSFYEEFVNSIKTLSVNKLNIIKSNSTNQVTQRIFKYFEINGVTDENLISELKEDFSKDKCIAVDSKNDSDEKQLIVNSLEDENNEYRAVFAVDKLNEGWDVLNLFDIVRLYNTRDADHKSGKIGKTTMSEAQLIGRGARYCPFQITKEQSLYKRKYDDDLENDLRICEELYYHSAHNPKYISELNKALEEIGIKASKTVQKRLKLKDNFKETDFYKYGFIYVNEKNVYDRSDIHELDKSIKEKIYKKKFLTGYTSVNIAFEEDEKTDFKNDTKIYKINTFTIPILRKAINKLPFYRFNNLQHFYPHLTSISEFISSVKFLKDVQVEIEGTSFQVQNPTNEMKLEATIKVLDDISKLIPQGSVEFKGSKVFKPQGISNTFTDKTMNIAVNEDGDQEYGVAQSETANLDLFINLNQEDWFAFNDNYGTSEEKYLVKYIKQALPALKSKFDEIYLLRNERHFTLYTFEEGQAFEPDFVLHLKQSQSNISTFYQVFIEPKGGDRLTNDDSKIKERFLKQIQNEFKLETIFKNKEFKLLGMPLYNESHKKTEFVNAFKTSLQIQ